MKQLTLNVLRGFLQFAVLAILLTAPLGYSQDPGLLMLEAGFLLMGLALLYPVNESAQYGPRSLVFLACFLLWVGLTLGHSLSFFHTERRLATWVAAFAVMLAMIEVHRSRPSLRITSNVVAAGTALYGLACLVVTAGNMLAHEQAGGRLNVLSFANTDCCACFMLGGVGIALAMVMNRGKYSVEWWLGVVESGILSLTILLTGSRMGVVGWFVILIVLVRLARKERRRWETLVSLFSGPLAAFTVLMVLVLFFGQNDPLVRFKELAGPTAQGIDSYERNAQLSVRGMVYAHGLAAFMRAPLAGGGLANFALAFQPVRPAAAFGGYVNEAHCEVIQFLVETGVVGLALLVGLWYFSLYPMFRKGDSTARRGAVVSLLGILVYGLANFSQTVGPNLIWIAALLGLAAGAVDAEKSGSEPRWQLPGTLVIALLLFCVGAKEAEFGYRVWKGVNLQYESLVLAAEYRWSDARTALSQAILDLPCYDELWAARGLMTSQLGEYTGRRVLLKEAQEDLEEAYRLGPIAKDVPYQVGAFFLKRGDIARAISVLLPAVDWYPQDHRRTEALAAAYLNQDRLLPAAEAYCLAIQSDQNAESTLAAILLKLQDEQHTGLPLLSHWLDSGQMPLAQGQRICQAVAELAIANHANRIGQPFERWLVEHPPANVCEQVRFGRLLYDNGDSASADRLMTTITHGEDLETESCRREALFLLADHRSPQGAVELLNNYLQVNSWDNDVRARLADAEASIGKMQSAISLYQDAVQRDPSTARFQARLGELYLQNGDRAQAESAFQEAVHLEPGNAAYVQKYQQLTNRSLLP